MIVYQYTIENTTTQVSTVEEVPDGVTYTEVDYVPFSMKSEVPDAKKANIKLAMIDSGIPTSMVDDYISNMPPSLEKDRISVLWYDTDTFQRKNETLNAIASIFKISQEQLDNLFILANTK
jgi:hypothetical protein